MDFISKDRRLYSFYDVEIKKYGLKDQLGNIAIPAVFDGIEGYESGFYCVWNRIENHYSSDILYGYVGRDGLFYSPKYSKPSSFGNGSVYWYMDSFCHILRNGRIVDHRCIEPQVNGLMILNHSVTEDGRHKVLDICGEHCFTFPEDVITEPSLKNENGHTKIDQNGGYYADWYIEPDGILTRSKFDGTKSRYLASIEHKLCFIDNSKSAVIAADLYEEAFDFSCGLARVINDGKYGFIDETGKVVIPIEMDYCEDFVDGTANFRDFSKEPVQHAIKFDSETGHEQSVISVRRSYIQGLPTQIRDSLEKSFENIGQTDLNIKMEYNDEQYVLITDISELKTDYLPDLDSPPPFPCGGDSEDVCNESDSEDDSDWLNFISYSAVMEDFFNYCKAWGIIDATGAIIADPRTGPQEPGRAGPYRQSIMVNGKAKAGYIDNNWDFVISPVYDFAESFQHGFAKVTVEHKDGIINSHGDYIVNPEFSYLSMPAQYLEMSSAGYTIQGVKHDKRYNIVIKDEVLMSINEIGDRELIPGITLYTDPKRTIGGYGIIDATGKVISQLGEFHEFERINDSFATLYDVNEAEHVLDKLGNITKKQYTTIRDCGEGTTFVTEFEGEQQIFNEATPYIIDSVLRKHRLEKGTWLESGFFEGLAVASFSENHGKKYGYIDKEGNTVISGEFTDLHPFNNGVAYAQINGYWGIINQEGEYIIPPLLDDICGSFHNGFVWVVYKGKMFEMNAEGQLFLRREVVGRVLAPLPKQLDGKWGYVDSNGHIIIPAIYDSAGFFNLDFAKVRQGEWDITIDYDGRIVSAERIRL